MRLPFPKMCNITHSLLVIGKEVIRLCFTRICNVTQPHLLLAIGKDDKTVSHTNV